MLKDKSIQHVYSSSGTDLTPFHFFNDALSNSTKFDLGLGFFSTASINVLSVGFANFIVNGGVMRLYINQFLSEEDYKVISSSTPVEIDKKILSDFYKLRETLSNRDEHFFNCLSYLISENRVEIRIVIPKTGGIAHQKFGVFSDEEGNKIAFNGSLNFTASALLSKNIEAISCATSWDGGMGQIFEYERLFDKFFNGNDSDIIVYRSENFERELLRSFPPKEVDALLREEREFIKTINTRHGIIFDTMDCDKPRFPYVTGAFDYQIAAYQNWVKQEYSGIFAMATGTGKTITSLNCVLEEYKKSGVYKMLILVPTIDLVHQWTKEVGLFNYQNIYIVNSGTNWRLDLTTLKEDCEWGIDRNFVIISTYASFVDSTFQRLINALSDDHMVLIADEAHNVGASRVKKAFASLKIKKRIALSATPNRAFDEEGTREIEKLFNDQPPYCYSFSMEQAICANRLMKYLYFPRIVYLDSDEMEKYQMYTRMLLKYYDSSTKSFKNNTEVKKILMLRKNVLHKAQDKYRVFEAVIDELHKKDKTRYCFVYAPEGFDPNDDERIIENMQCIVNEKYPSIRTNSLVGGDARRKDKIRAFEEGHIDMLFAMKCLDEGVDVPRTEIGVFTSSTGNPRQFIQRRGRLLRKHKDKQFATIYDLIVVPNFNYNRDKATFDMERSLVRGELTRVAYFASLASNYNEISSTLSELAEYYDLELSVLINELK